MGFAGGEAQCAHRRLAGAEVGHGRDICGAEAAEGHAGKAPLHAARLAGLAGTEDMEQHLLLAAVAFHGVGCDGFDAVLDGAGRAGVALAHAVAHVVEADVPEHALRAADGEIDIAHGHGGAVAEEIFLRHRVGEGRRADAGERGIAGAHRLQQREAGVAGAGLQGFEAEVVGETHREVLDPQPVLIAGCPDAADAVVAEDVADQVDVGVLAAGHVVAERGAAQVAVLPGGGAGLVLDLDVVRAGGGGCVHQSRHLAAEAVVVAAELRRAVGGIEGDERIEGGVRLVLVHARHELVGQAGDQLDPEEILVARNVDAGATALQIGADRERNRAEGAGAGRDRDPGADEDVLVIADPGVGAVAACQRAAPVEVHGEPLGTFGGVEVGGDVDGQVLLGLAGGEGHRAAEGLAGMEVGGIDLVVIALQ